MQLIVAFDEMPDEKTALAFADACAPEWCVLKVGLEAFTRFGPSFVGRLVQRGFRVFLDLKFHDIPNTVAAACKAAADLGVWMLNVHAAGGETMMQAAHQALAGYQNKPHLIAVTVLTSQALSEEQSVVALAKRAKAANLAGVVCAAREVPAVKAACGADFLTVTPGIRLAGDVLDDQKRVVTPDEARRLGSDYIVMGRSIMRAHDPIEQIKALVLDAS